MRKPSACHHRMSSGTQDTRQMASRDDRLKEDLSASRFRSPMFKSEGTFEAHITGFVTMENLNIVPRLSMLAAPA